MADAKRLRPKTRSVEITKHAINSNGKKKASAPEALLTAFLRSPTP